VSRPSVALQSPDFGLESIAARLKVHDWVADARLISQSADSECGARSDRSVVFIVPSRLGVGALRRNGKRNLVAAWRDHLCLGGIAETSHLDWRMIRSLSTEAAMGTALGAWPPRQPTVADVVHAAGSSSLACRVQIPYELALFDGHFPAAPIVPGVTQVGWAVDIARDRLQVTGRFRGIAAAKFRRLVQPGLDLVLNLRHEPAVGQLRFEYSLGHAVVSAGRVQFGRSDE